MKAIKRFFLLAVAFLTASFGAVAQVAAAGPDLTALTSGIDWGTTIAAIIAIAAGLAGVYVIVLATRLVITRLKAG